MVAAVREIPIRISATNETAAAAAAARSEVKALANDVRSVGNAGAAANAGGIKELLGSLKENFGRGSVLSMGLKSLSFSGPLVGVGLFLDKIEALGHATVEYLRHTSGFEGFFKDSAASIDAANKALEARKKLIEENAAIEDRIAAGKQALGDEGQTVGGSSIFKAQTENAAKLRADMARIQKEEDDAFKKNHGQFDNSGFNEERQQAQANFGARAKEIAKEDAKAIADETLKGDRSLASEQANIRAAELRALNRDLDAENELRRAKLAERISILEEERKRRLKEHAGDSENINRQIDDQERAARRQAQLDQDEAAKKNQRELDAAGFGAIKSAAGRSKDLKDAQNALAFAARETAHSSGFATGSTEAHLTGVGNARINDPNLKELQDHTKLLQQCSDYLGAVARQFNPGMAF